LCERALGAASETRDQKNKKDFHCSARSHNRTEEIPLQSSMQSENNPELDL
jgi:hypothetical protein